MNKVIAMLALLALTGNIASAELLKNFKYDGKIEVNAYQDSNEDWDKDLVDGKRNDVDTRVQLNMGFDLNEDVNAVVSVVKNDRQYGAGVGAQNATGANGILDLIKFEQAYLNLKGVLGFDHKLGRQYYGNEGDLVVYYGPTGMPFQPALPVSAIDGYTGWYKTGKWDIHGILAKVNNFNNTADEDRDLFGVNAKYDLMEEVKLNGYFYQHNWQAGSSVANPGPNDHLQVAGIKAMGKYMGIEYGAEFAKNMGRTNERVANHNLIPNNTTGDYAGSAFKANAKYGIDLAGKLDFMGEYAMGSGDDDVTNDEVASFQSIASDYRPGAIWGGYFGMSGLENITTYNVGAMWNPSKVEKLTIGAKYFNFAPTEDKGLGYDTVGNELDLSAKWQHSENVGLKAYYAMFMPDSDFAVAQNGAGASDDAETLLGAAFTVKF